MRHQLKFVSILLFLATITQPPALRAASPPTSSFVLTPNAQQTLLLWFECDHCPHRLLARVVQLGPGVVPYLDATLVYGPSLARLLDAAHFLHEQYAMLEQYEQTHPSSAPFPTKRDYIATHLLHLKVQYQIRAARALAAIGTPVAKQRLQNALQSATSSAVKAVINDALQ